MEGGNTPSSLINPCDARVTTKLARGCEITENEIARHGRFVFTGSRVAPYINDALPRHTTAELTVEFRTAAVHQDAMKVCLLRAYVWVFVDFRRIYSEICRVYSCLLNIVLGCI